MTGGTMQTARMRRRMSRTRRTVTGVAAAWLIGAGVVAWVFAGTPPGMAKGTVRRFRIQAPSAGDDSRTGRLYLPPPYSQPRAPERHHPDRYMLHGWPGSDGNLL